MSFDPRNIVYTGGRRIAPDGRIRGIPRPIIRGVLSNERRLHVVGSGEDTLWDKWMTMRDFIWSKASTHPTVQNVDKQTMLYDLDYVMRSVFDSCIATGGESATIDAMTQTVISILIQKWNYRFTPPPPTSHMPESMRPVVSTNKKHY
jgi:hypothetical protein